MTIPVHPQQSYPEEDYLIDRINQRFSFDEQQRLRELRDRNESGMITDTEHQELLTWIDCVESIDVDRVDAMIQLARLRGVELDRVVQEFSPIYSGV